MTGWKSSSEPFFRRRRVWAGWALFSFLAALISLATGERTRNELFDAWQRLAPRDLSNSDVRFVMIDGESLNSIGPWPWSRYYLARLTEELRQGGAAVIGFDIIFPEPDRLQPDQFVKFYPELSSGAAAEILALQPMDRLFGEVIGQSTTVLARAGSPASAATRGEVWVDAAFKGQLPPGIYSWPGIIASVPDIDDNAIGHGLINGQPDRDGVIRSVPLLGRAGGKLMPGLALEMARIRLGAEEVAVLADRVSLGSLAIPIDGRGRMRLHFGAVPPASIVSAEDVLRRRVEPGLFRGRVVLVGLGAEGTADIVTTPLAAEDYGLLVQGTAIDSILSNGWLDRPGWAVPAEWVVAILIAGLALLLAARPRAAKLVFPAGMIALPVAGWFLFREASILLDPVRPMLLGAGAAAGVAAGLLAEARQDRQQLRDALVTERIAAAAAEGELEAARKIQLGMVPPRASLADVDPRLDIDALLEPAKSVGGDLYDCIRTGPDTIGFAIGDVTGKGVPAALFMAMSKALLSSALCRERQQLAEAVDAINRDLMRSNEETMSVTMIVGQIDLASGAAQLVCAGHEDPYVVDAQGNIRRCALTGGPPLGMVEFDYPVDSIQLATGETLVLVTDGITEAQDESAALYGRARIMTAITGSRLTARSICEAARDDVRRFEGSTDPTDDLTIMALRYLGPAA
ncbi:MAG: CHASE2 domain-containing protein [Sphingomonas sp.]|nr:CHASE2 domain-containing protein [Sphingomonas sp.]